MPIDVVLVIAMPALTGLRPRGWQLIDQKREDTPKFPLDLMATHVPGGQSRQVDGDELFDCVGSRSMSLPFLWMMREPADQL